MSDTQLTSQGTPTGAGEAEGEAAAPPVVELAAAILDALNPPAAVSVSASAIAKRTDLIETRAAVVTGALRSLAADPDLDDLDDDVRTSVGAIRKVIEEYPVTYPTPQEKSPKTWTDRDGWVWDLTRAYGDERAREWRFTGAWHVSSGDGFREPSFGCKDVNERDWPVSALVRSFELCRRAVCVTCGEPVGEVARDAWVHEDWEIEGHKASPVVQGGEDRG